MNTDKYANLESDIKSSVIQINTVEKKVGLILKKGINEASKPDKLKLNNLQFDTNKIIKLAREGKSKEVEKMMNQLKSKWL